jgi:universal stress protein A
VLPETAKTGLIDLSLASLIGKSYSFVGFGAVPEVSGPESDPQKCGSDSVDSQVDALFRIIERSKNMSPLFKKIGFCTDFSDNADQAFIVARDLAVQLGASIEIIHVTTDLALYPPELAFYAPGVLSVEEITQAALKLLQEKYVKKLPKGLVYDVNILVGYAATEILKVVEEKEIDLVVMGTHGLTGIAHVLFGSIAERVVRRAACSVLTVRLRKS